MDKPQLVAGATKYPQLDRAYRIGTRNWLCGLSLLPKTTQDMRESSPSKATAAMDRSTQIICVNNPNIT